MRLTLFSERLVVRLHCHGKQLTVAPAVAKRHHITAIHIGHSLPQSSHLLCAIAVGGKKTASEDAAFHLYLGAYDLYLR